ncbi:hypothetical protein CLOSTASPAR_06484 [[Clostridium] asparagiforme DSM 15981]|uniref:Uncharacterized protein n=1 Tax=[Clostridium] asparagiforme DSM 15981 TaxID=518636 RepID=C0DB29_9FIRM|nr:hypothetical protein CLOSTASPAR_06484 [[Clostridium] asparagiforme DSM 15981]
MKKRTIDEFLAAGALVPAAFESMRCRADGSWLRRDGKRMKRAAL